MRKLVTLLSLAPLALGCTDDDPAARGEPLPIEAGAIRTTVIANVRAMTDIAWSAEKFLDEAATINDADAIFMAFAERGEGDPADEEYEYEDEEGGGGFLLPLDQAEFADFKDELEHELTERVFRDDQIESRTATSVTYLLAGVNVCGTDDEEPPTDCIDGIDAARIRFEVSSVVEGDLDVRVLVGDDRKEAALLEIHRDVLSLSVNIGPTISAMLDAVRAIDPETVADVPTARGTVRFVLRRLSSSAGVTAGDALRASVEVVSPITIEGTGDDGELSFHGEPGSVALEVDRGARTAELDVDLNTLSLEAPKQLLASEDTCYDDFGEYDESLCERLEGRVAFSNDRLAGIVRLVDNDASARVEGLIAGPFAFLVDDEPIVRLALEGEPIDLAFDTSDDQLDLTVTGAAELGALFEMAKAADLLEDVEDSWVAHDLLGVALTQPTTELRINDDVGTLLKGHVDLTSAARPELDKHMDAGMCVWFEATEDIGSTQPGDALDDGEGIDGHPFNFEVGDVCGDNPPS